MHAKSCPVCTSMERHRWVWIFLNTQSNLFDRTPKKMLHIAPERPFTSLFRKIPNMDYLSGDLCPGRAMECIDITRIQYSDESFDVIYCSHVLEHVPDDTKAIQEFYRVLGRDGWALVVVPVLREETFEDWSVTEPEDRLRVFRHPEHVRICGRDYKDRFEAAGFSVEVIDPEDVLSEEQIKRLGLIREPLFFCKKGS